MSFVSKGPNFHPFSTPQDYLVQKKPSSSTSTLFGARLQERKSLNKKSPQVGCNCIWQFWGIFPYNNSELFGLVSCLIIPVHTRWANDCETKKKLSQNDDNEIFELFFLSQVDAHPGECCLGSWFFWYRVACTWCTYWTLLCGDLVLSLRGESWPPQPRSSQKVVKSKGIRSPKWPKHSG